MILHENIKFGDVVYCQLNQQVYMVERWQDDSEKLYLKNLTNLEAPPQYLYRNQLCDLPDNWGTKDWYEHLAKIIVDSRK